MQELTPREQREQAIDLLLAFRKATTDLCQFWTESDSKDSEDEDDLCLNDHAVKLYPFAASFDELTFGIEMWIDDTITSLKR